MTKHTRRLIVPLLGAAFFTSLLKQDEFLRLDVLVGLWRMETSKGPLFERWERFDEVTLAGESFRISEDDTIRLESIRLVSRPEGIFYIPIVENQNDGQPVSFKLISSDDNRFVFENRQHDFPQRIIYSIVTKDSIVARIEGISKGKVASSDFYYRRIHPK